MNDIREISTEQIEEAVERLCIKANTHIPGDILRAMRRFSEENGNTFLAKKVLSILLENAKISAATGCPLCQDTGIVNVFMEIGQDVHFVGGSLEKAIDRSVMRAYKRGGFRMSIVDGPINRQNTGTNTPAMKYFTIVPGNKVDVTVYIKGGGSENVTRLKMFNPTVELSSIEQFVIDSVQDAGGKACPPFYIGIGMGGSSERAMELSKRAIFSKKGISRHKKLAEVLLGKLNSLNIGPAGFGGKPTVLGVKILDAPTHIATFPVAVNINCNSVRYARTRL